MIDFARYLNIRAATTPVLSPDGQRVAYLTDVTGNFQVWSVGLTGEGAATWPRQLTFFADKVWDVYGSAHSPYLIAMGDVGGNERQQFYRIDNYGADEQGEPVFDVVRLTQNDAAIHTFGAWMGDGSGFYYTSNARNNVDFDIYAMDVETGKSRCLAEVSGRWAVVDCSPDGRALLCMDSVASEQIELYVVTTADGAIRHLTAGLDHARYESASWTQAGVYLLSDRTHDRKALCRLDPVTGDLTELLNAAACDRFVPYATGEFELFKLALDGRTAALVLNVEGAAHLFMCDVTDAAATLRPVECVRGGQITDLQFSRDGKTLVFDWQTPQRPSDIWAVTVDAAGTQAAPRQLTFSDRTGIDAATFVAPELIHFPTFDERSFPAFFYRPQSAPPPTGYPCILYVHGGPAAQQRPDFDVRFQYFLRQGYALLATNVRGSTGYGRDYMMLDDVEKRMDSVKDLRYAVAWLHEQPDVDSERIGIYGRSYGGFMVLAALTEYPDLFAAGVEEVGIADWVTFLERTSPWRRGHREREYGSLAEHRDFLRSISPLHKAERITAPLMVLAGDNDPRVPLYESEQIAAKVAAAGGTVKFVHYADEGHRFSKLANRIDSFTQIGDFWHTYLRRDGSPAT